MGQIRGGGATGREAGQMTSKLAVDWSTINNKVLSRLPVFKKPPSYVLEKGMGNCCFLDPPGYPTYFTRCVYTKHGNSPSKGPQKVLRGHVVEAADWMRGHQVGWDVHESNQDKLMRKLYVQLRFDHPRVQEWVIAAFRHWAKCYKKSGDDTTTIMSTIIWPDKNYKMERLDDDPRLLCVERNHLAVKHIRKWYPSFCVADLFAEGGICFGSGKDPAWVMANGIPGRCGNEAGIVSWWERHSRRPTEEECPGTEWLTYGTGTSPHRSGFYCQLCGRTGGAKEEKE